jgi:hypothetical protein
MSSLKKIYTAVHAIDAHMLKGLFAQEGIVAVVRGDDFVPLQGGNLFNMEVRPSVWVFDDARLDRAQELADEFWRRPTPSDHPRETWACHCGESIEVQFSECWNCGHQRG